MSGKGSSPRNNFSNRFRQNYDKIDFSVNKKTASEWSSELGFPDLSSDQTKITKTEFLLKYNK